MDTAPRTGSAADSYARSRVGSYMSDSGLCLQCTRENYGVAAAAASAIDAWNAAKYKHTSSPPSGSVVPVFFKTASVYDHVVTRMANGQCVTTDGAAIELWSSIDSIAAGFGGTYLGWTEDLNGVRVYTDGGDGGTSDGDITVDGVWGTATTKKAQQVYGTTADGVVSGQDASWKSQNPGLTSGWDWQSGSKVTGSELMVAIQAEFGVSPRDGLIGPSTIKTMQKRYGISQDGHLDNPSMTIEAFQRALNAGKKA